MIARGIPARLIAVLLALAGLAAVELAFLSPAKAATGGCSREPGTPIDSGANGLPGCGGAGDDCYYCEYSNPNGGYTVCSEYPDPADGSHCVNIPVLPGRRPQNQAS
jgi:hypothetical protein